MKKKKIAKYMQETETPTNPKALYDKGIENIKRVFGKVEEG